MVKEQKMKHDKNVSSKEQRTLAELLFVAWRTLLYGIVSIYMLLILAVLPFYNTEGYAHIGTDKAEFLLRSTIYCGGAILPVVILTGIVKIVVLLQKYGWEAWYNLDGKQVAAYFRKRYSVTDCFAILYGISIVVSYLCSNYREDALWGAEYWYMGSITQLSLVIVYFLISRARAGQKWLAMLVLPVSAVVFVLGYLNRFGIYPIDMTIQNVQFVSTIGNINWYCGYLVTLFFGGFYVFCYGRGQKLWQRLLLGGYVLIGFATLVTQGSSSGILTLLVMLLVLFCRFADKSLEMMNFWKGMTLMSVACLGTYVLRKQEILEITYLESTTELFTNSAFPIIVTVVSVAVLLVLFWCKEKIGYPRGFFIKLSKRVRTGSMIVVGVFVILMVINTVGEGAVSRGLFDVTGVSLNEVLTFSPTWGSNRGATWMAGVRCFAEQDILHMLVGVGPDCMGMYLYRDGSESLVSMVQSCFGSARLTNAHNEWLTILVNTGLVGAVSFVGMMVSGMKRFLGAAKAGAVNNTRKIPGKGDNNKTDGGRMGKCEEVLAVTCGMCLLAYTINNMFSFQQAMNVSTIYVVLGVGENALRRRKLEEAEMEKATDLQKVDAKKKGVS